MGVVASKRIETPAITKKKTRTWRKAGLSPDSSGLMAFNEVNVKTQRSIIEPPGGLSQLSITKAKTVAMPARMPRWIQGMLGQAGASERLSERVLFSGSVWFRRSISRMRSERSRRFRR